METSRKGLTFLTSTLCLIGCVHATLDIPQAQPGNHCPSTVEWFWDNVTGRCFRFYLLNKWPLVMANSQCPGTSGSLIHIDNAYVYNIAKQFANEPKYVNGWQREFWIGSIRKEDEYYTFTGNDSNVDEYYTRWRWWKPLGGFGVSKMCAAMEIYGIGIIEAQCWQLKYYLCEYTPPGISTGCPFGFFQSFETNKCYMIRNDRLGTFQRARRWCYDHGADMFIVNSPQEKQVVASFGFASSFWIGLTDIQHENHFIWVNGHQLSWTDWRTGEPDNSGGEHCAEMYLSGSWNDKNCVGARKYACQRPKHRASENGGCPGESWRYVETGRCYYVNYDINTFENAAYSYCQFKGGFLAAKPVGLEAKFNRLIESFNIEVRYNGTTMAAEAKGTPLCEFLPAQGDCRSGYFYHQHLETCYRIVDTQTKNWDDARADCKTVPGGDLIQVTNRDVYDFLAITILKSIWLGARRYDESDINKFVWVKSNTSVWNWPSSWGPGQPGNAGGRGDERCMQMYSYPVLNHQFKKWNDNDCTKQFNYVCEHHL